MDTAGHAHFGALLIDLDGVLRRWPASDAAIECRFGLAEGAIRAAAFERSLLQDVVTGKISDEAWRQRVVERLQARYPAAPVADAIADWARDIGVVNEDVLDLVRRCAQTLRIVLVTNGTSRLHADLAALGLTEYLDAVVSSNVVGAAKPDPEIYMAAIQAAGVCAAEALFVDDSTAHVAAAERLGMRVLHFTGSETLAAFLQHCGVLNELENNVTTTGKG